MRCWLLLLLFHLTSSAFGQQDTLYAIPRNHEGGEMVYRFWPVIHHIDTNLIGEVCNYKRVFISTFKDELTGKDSIFTGFVAFCCDGSPYLRESRVREVLYDETCECKQYNYYENGILKFTDTKEIFEDGKIGFDRTIYESDSSTIYLTYDLSQNVKRKEHVWSSGDTLYRIHTSGQGEIRFSSLEWLQDSTHYESVNDKRGRDHETGLLINGAKVGTWKLKYADGMEINVTYESNIVLDIESDDIIYIGLNAEAISKQHFFYLLNNSDSVEYSDSFHFNLEDYIMRIPSDYSKRKKNKLLMIRLPLDDLKLPQNEEEEAIYYHKLLGDFHKSN